MHRHQPHCLHFLAQLLFLRTELSLLIAQLLFLRTQLLFLPTELSLLIAQLLFLRTELLFLRTELLFLPTELSLLIAQLLFLRTELRLFLAQLNFLVHDTFELGWKLLTCFIRQRPCMACNLPDLYLETPDGLLNAVNRYLSRLQSLTCVLGFCVTFGQIILIHAKTSCGTL